MLLPRCGGDKEPPERRSCKECFPLWSTGPSILWAGSRTCSTPGTAGKPLVSSQWPWGTGEFSWKCEEPSSKLWRPPLSSTTWAPLKETPTSGLDSLFRFRSKPLFLSPLATFLGHWYLLCSPCCSLARKAFTGFWAARVWCRCFGESSVFLHHLRGCHSVVGHFPTPPIALRKCGDFSRLSSREILQLYFTGRKPR